MESRAQASQVVAAGNLNPQDSRAKRLERQQARFRDRGGIFVPSNRNTLLEVLLARLVNGESPQSAAAKQPPRKRSPSSSPARRPGQKPKTQSGALRTKTSKGDSGTDSCQPIAGPSRLASPVNVAPRPGKQVANKRKPRGDTAQTGSQSAKVGPPATKRNGKPKKNTDTLEAREAGASLEPPTLDEQVPVRKKPRASKAKSSSNKTKASSAARKMTITEGDPDKVESNRSSKPEKSRAPQKAFPSEPKDPDRDKESTTKRKGKKRLPVDDDLPDRDHEGETRSNTKAKKAKQSESQRSTTKRSAKDKGSAFPKASRKESTTGEASQHPEPVSSSRNGPDDNHTSENTTSKQKRKTQKRKQDEILDDQQAPIPPPKRPKKHPTVTNHSPDAEGKPTSIGNNVKRTVPSSKVLKENSGKKDTTRLPGSKADKPKPQSKRQISRQPPKDILERIRREMNVVLEVDGEPDPIDFLS